MRRALIVSIAILALFASSAVMAGEQQVSDRLLEILKERQIISENEFAELSDLAEEMQDDQQLSALDASISEYLAKEGEEDEAGVAVKHKKGTGFGFSQGNFELWIGGLFQFEYYGLDVEYGTDTNNFRVKEARLHLSGKAFVEGFSYMFKFLGQGQVSLLDAWVNYKITDGVQIRAGQFKTPYSRQILNDPAKLQLMNASIVASEFAPGYDVGIMAHDVAALGEDDDMAIEWALGFFNGDGTNVQGNDNNWLGWVARVGFYPMGFVKYGESDLANTQDLKFGVAASVGSFQNRTGIGGSTEQTDLLGFDFVLAWSGFFMLAEIHSRSIEQDVVSTPSGEYDDKGWYIQPGFVIPDTEFEVIGRYSQIMWDEDRGLDNTSAWQIGVAWYPGQEGHPFKALIAFGQAKVTYAGGASGPTAGGIPSGSDIAALAAAHGDTYFLRIAFQLAW
ncbi:MAG: porin [Planctomycetota bacterium]